MSFLHQNALSPSPIANYSFAVVGLARNCERTVFEDVKRIRGALSNARSISWLIVESDSADGTREELAKLQAELPAFNFTSLGVLVDKFPRRTERIAHCRNYYRKKIDGDDKFSAVDYVVVADLDDLNTLISPEAIESCWARQDWDMCAANQRGPYYDIWALRHDEWSPGDCWSQYKFLNRHRLSFEKNLYASVFSKMLIISPEAEWIAVASAFGGLAIYTKSAFALGEYSGLNAFGEEFCEHVHFNKKIREAGGKMFINPRLINAGFTEHTRDLKFRRRMKRKLRFALKEALIHIMQFLQNSLKDRWTPQ